MLRRQLVLGLSMLACAPSLSLAQAPSRPKRIVHLMAVNRDLTANQLAEWRAEGHRVDRALWASQGLQEGRDYYQQMAEAGMRPNLVHEIVASRPDLILVHGGQLTAEVAALTIQVPIVFWGVSDAIAWGLVQTLGRPGANVTGVTASLPESIGKRLELLRAVRPRALRFAYVVPRRAGPRPKAADLIKDDVAGRARQLDLTLVEVGVPEPLAFEAIVTLLREAGCDGFVPFSVNTDWVAVQSRCGTPGFFEGPHIVRRGGFASYAADANQRAEAIRIAARILRGESPATIPVHQPSRFYSSLNLKTAAALGIDVPEAVLLRVDEVVRA